MAATEEDLGRLLNYSVFLDYGFADTEEWLRGTIVEMSQEIPSSRKYGFIHFTSCPMRGSSYAVNLAPLIPEEVEIVVREESWHVKGNGRLGGIELQLDDPHYDKFRDLLTKLEE